MTESTGRAAAAGALDRVGARKLLHRAGMLSEPAGGLATDTPQVARLLADGEFAGRLRTLAADLGIDPAQARQDAAGYLREMGACHDRRAMAAWARFGGWMFRAHDLLLDAEKLRQLRALDRKHSLLFLFSHRSYLDGWAVPLALQQHGVSPLFMMGGANLNFFPFNAVARRSGIVYIRRSIADLPVYRLTLRSYIAELIRDGHNLGWSIEGGRTRTGKLRPPAYGILRYVLDAVEATAGTEALIIPGSVVYDQLHEVGPMISEATGGSKRPEDIRWLVNYARSQRHRLGHAYVDFGEPIPVRERLAELRAEDPTGRHVVERVALDTMHRINRATPVTATAVVCVAMLAADRALSLDEVLATVAPLARYIEQRRWAVAGAATLTDRATIRRTLQELVSSGVLTSYDGGTETIWDIAPHQHLVAAFYRNSMVHILLDRAIGELALAAAAESQDAVQTAEDETLRLRELLKFDFFFPRRRDFAEEMRAELGLIDPDGLERIGDFGPQDARRWLAHASPLMSPLMLRPFLDAYHVVADRLAAWDDEDDFDEPRFLDECLRVGRQWAMQHRLASMESVSLELFKSALRLARHRDLVRSTAPELAKRRQAFAAELRETIRLADTVAELARPAGAAA
jgi:glycerol-3-phosphate O-acyltransferase